MCKETQNRRRDLWLMHAAKYFNSGLLIIVKKKKVDGVFFNINVLMINVLKIEGNFLEKVKSVAHCF